MLGDLFYFNHPNNRIEMKKIIKWLADISGVTNDIEKQTRIEVGHDLNSQKYWWTGGANKPMYEVMNAFHISAWYYLNGFYRPDIQRMRDEVYKLGNTPHKDL